MQYKCKSCEKTFEFPDDILFCPYCAEALSENINAQSANGKNNDFANVIDSIWGEKSNIKSEFLELITDCFNNIGLLSKAELVNAMPTQIEINYNEKFEVLKKSDNRRNLLSRIQNLLDEFNSIIINLDDDSISDFEQNIKAVSEKSESKISEICSLIGFSYSSESKQNRNECKNNSAALKYGKEQLSILYNLVVEAFKKYQRCVNDNDIFAAFSSDSDYGMLKGHGRYSYYDEDREENERTEEDLNYEEVIKKLQADNSLKYNGYLDEVITPHVDSFWFGLNALADFIENRMEIHLEGFMEQYSLIEIYHKKAAKKISTSPDMLTDTLFEEIEKINSNNCIEIERLTSDFKI